MSAYSKETILETLDNIWLPEYFGIVGPDDDNLNAKMAEAAKACIESIKKAVRTSKDLNSAQAAAFAAIKDFMKVYNGMPQESVDPYSDSHVWIFVEDCMEATLQVEKTREVFGS